MRKTMIWKRAVAACLATIMLVSAPGSYSVGKEATVETTQVNMVLDKKVSDTSKEASGEDIISTDSESEAASIEETQSKEMTEPTSSETCNETTVQTQETTIEGTTKEESSASGTKSEEESSASETESKEESSTPETASEEESSTSETESKEESSISGTESKEESSTSETKSEEESTEETTTEEESTAEEVKLDVPVLKEGKTLVDASVLLYWQQVADADGYYIYRKQQGGNWQKIADVTQTKYHDSKVSEGQTYYYTVAAHDSEGHESDYDDKGIGVKTQKQTPTMKRAFVNNTREIGVEWETLQGASCYYIYRKTDSNKWEQIDILYGQVGSWTDTTADYGVKYTYTVRAGFQYDDEFVLSDYAKVGVSAKIQHTLPSVTGFRVGTVQDTTIQLKWDSVNGAQGYIIYQYDAEAKTWKRIAKTANTSYIVKDLKAGTNYQFAIRGYQTLNQKENLSTSYPVREQRTKLSTVTGFKTSQVKDTSVQLKWNGVSKAEGYIVYRYSASEKTWKRIAKTTNTSYTVKNLSAGTDYWFAVKGYQTVNGKENVSVSYPKVKQRTKLSTVTGFKTSQVKDTSVQLKWNGVGKAEGYIVYRYSASEKTWKRIAKTTNTSYTVKDLSAGTDYWFAVKGYQTVNGKENVSVSYPKVKQRTKLSTVTGFKTSQVKDTSVQLKWNSVNKASGYIIYQYDTGANTWKRVAKTTNTSYMVKNLSAGTDCWFAVKGYQTVNGKENVSVSYPKVKQRTKLSTVTGFKTSQVKDTSVQLQWSALSKASGYIIYQYDTSANTWKRIAKTTNTSTSYTVSNLRNNTSYQFAIRGYQSVNGKENKSISYPTLKITTKQKGNHTTANGRVLPIFDVRTSEAKISLTFDSAWGTEDLGQILSILKKYNVPACFFVTGGFVDKHPDAIQSMLDNGHTIGSHGNTHTQMTTLSAAQKYAEVNDLHQKMKNRFGVEMKYFRPPYGDFDNDTINTALNQNYMPIQWSVDSLDWKNYGVQSIIDTVVNNSAMRNGAIILMHNGSTYTAQALEQVIVQLQYRGYQFVSLDDLVLDYNYYVDAAGTQIGY